MPSKYSHDELVAKAREGTLTAADLEGVDTETLKAVTLASMQRLGTKRVDALVSSAGSVTKLSDDRDDS